ncbi:uncharacterized protein LOC116177384 [Photinus pyralis]|uniref:uncharacterized protein LOC116177384 n=1 Tax=Photinus pyralis TaxID=7054 RepID=UPI0012672ED2|nr:uncharacterized protein LOC116177384 [Photinus pyralis]
MSTEILRLTTFSALLAVLCGIVIAAPLDDENEYMTHDGNWVAYHLLKNDYLNQLKHLPLANRRLYGYPGKRNSELSNSMMGLPLNMIDNGKK